MLDAGWAMRHCFYVTIKLNLLGKRFDQLLVIAPAENISPKQTAWLCKCECGVEKVIATQTLREGKVHSCGHDLGDLISLSNRRRALPGDLAAIRQLIRWYKRSARDRGLVFSISLSEFRTLTSQPCFYCGCPPNKLITNPSGSSKYLYNGIDRKDNTVGYLLENCIPCCHTHNMMRRDMSQEDFVAACRQVASHFMRQP